MTPITAIMTLSTDTPLNWQYLEIEAQQKAKIANSRISVSQLIQEKHAHGWSPEELHFQHPEISLAAVYSALSYYYTYQTAIDAQIEQEKQTIDTLTSELTDMGIARNTSEFKQKIQQKREQKS